MREPMATPNATAASDRLVMRWTPVTDARGRTRMAAHWVPADAVPAAAHHAA